jgi:hypothetical protein
VAPCSGSIRWQRSMTAEIGLTAQHSFTGSGLGSKWSDPNRRSSFFGTFLDNPTTSRDREEERDRRRRCLGQEMPAAPRIRVPFC